MIALTRDEAIQVLGTIEDAIDHLMPHRVFTLVVALDDAVRILIDRLFPDLPPATDPGSGGPPR